MGSKEVFEVIKNHWVYPQTSCQSLLITIGTTMLSFLKQSRGKPSIYIKSRIVHLSRMMKTQNLGRKKVYSSS